MFCSSCGNQLQEGEAFCPECGARIVQPSVGARPHAQEPGGGNAQYTQIPGGGRAQYGQGYGAPAGQYGQGYGAAPDQYVQGAGNVAPQYSQDYGQGYPQNTQPSSQGDYVTPNIMRCGDGVFRWVYSMHMLKNPTILITVYKVLGLSMGIVAAFATIVQLFDGGFDDGFEGFLKFVGCFLIIYLVFVFIGFISYLIVAASYGWYYVVLFEMDDEKVVHIQTPKQFDKAKGLAWLTSFAGVMTGNVAMVGQGLVTGAKSSSTSVFANVSSVKVKRGRNVIYVNQTLEKNQVYAADEDFDFVSNFILSRCVKAKIK